MIRKVVDGLASRKSRTRVYDILHKTAFTILFGGTLFTGAILGLSAYDFMVWSKPERERKFEQILEEEPKPEDILQA